MSEWSYSYKEKCKGKWIKKLKTDKGNNDIAQCNIRPVTMHYIVDCQMSGRGRNCY